MIDNIQKLRFWIGGYGSVDKEITIVNNVAVFRSSIFGLFNDQDKIQKHLTISEMKKVISSLNILKVIDWKDNYWNNVLDGTQWKLEIEYNNGLKKKIFGSNCYPGKSDETLSYTPEFKRLLRIFDNLMNFSHFDEYD